MRRSFRRRGLIDLNGPREVRALLAVHPSMRFARVIIRNSLKIHMKSYTSGRSRPGRGRSRRRGGDGQRRRSDAKPAPQKKGFWSRIAGFFAAPEKAEQRNGSHSRQQARNPHKPEPIEVTSPRLYVGNLSFDATESDLFELFNGVGHVQNAEVVSYKHN